MNMESVVTSDKPEIPWLKNLSACVNRMKEEGYKEDFQVTDQGLAPFDKSKTWTPQQVSIVSFYRFEGESDPGDNTVLYVIETQDGHKGTLVDGYGAYADENVSKFIVEVKKIQKESKSERTTLTGISADGHCSPERMKHEKKCSNYCTFFIFMLSVLVASNPTV